MKADFDPIKNYSKGNRLWLMLGFSLVGAIQGGFHFEEAGERGGVLRKLDAIESEVSELKTEIATLSQTVQDAEKAGGDFRVHFASIEDRVRLIELKQATDEARGAKATSGG